MDFGMAIVALKRGECVARKGWNGKGMFLFLQKGVPIQNRDVVEYFGGDSPRVTPYICMKAADNSIIPGWLASQTDMLAEDWEIVKPAELKDEEHVKC